MASISEILGSLGELKGKKIYTFAKFPMMEQKLHGVLQIQFQCWLLSPLLPPATNDRR